jgi:hypothetical protein
MQCVRGLGCFKDKSFKFGNAAGIGKLLTLLEAGLHVLIEVGHAQSLQVPICGCTLHGRVALTSSSAG